MLLIKTISNLQIRYYRNVSTEPAGKGHGPFAIRGAHFQNHCL